MNLLYQCLNDIISLTGENDDIIFLIYEDQVVDKFNICVIFTLCFFAQKFKWTIKKSREFFLLKNFDFSFFDQDNILDEIQKFEIFLKEKLACKLSDQFEYFPLKFDENSILNNTMLNIKNSKREKEIKLKEGKKKNKYSIKSKDELTKKNGKKKVKFFVEEDKNSFCETDKSKSIKKRSKSRKKSNGEISITDSPNRSYKSYKKIRNRLIQDSSLKKSRTNSINKMVRDFHQKNYLICKKSLKFSDKSKQLCVTSNKKNRSKTEVNPLKNCLSLKDLNGEKLKEINKKNQEKNPNKFNSFILKVNVSKSDLHENNLKKRREILEKIVTNLDRSTSKQKKQIKGTSSFSSRKNYNYL